MEFFVLIKKLLKKEDYLIDPTFYIHSFLFTYKISINHNSFINSIQKHQKNHYY